MMRMEAREDARNTRYKQTRRNTAAKKSNVQLHDSNVNTHLLLGTSTKPIYVLQFILLLVCV